MDPEAQKAAAIAFSRIENRPYLRHLPSEEFQDWAPELEDDTKERLIQTLLRIPIPEDPYSAPRKKRKKAPIPPPQVPISSPPAPTRGLSRPVLPHLTRDPISSPLAPSEDPPASGSVPRATSPPAPAPSQEHFLQQVTDAERATRNPIRGVSYSRTRKAWTSTILEALPAGQSGGRRKEKKRTFSVALYGEDKARELAIADQKERSGRVVSEPQPPRSTKAAPSQCSRNEKEKQPPPPSMQLKTQPVSERTPGVSHVRAKNRWIVTFLDHQPCSVGVPSESSSSAPAPAKAAGSSDHQPISSSCSDPSHPASLSRRFRRRHFNTEQEALEFFNSLPKQSRLNHTRDGGLKKDALSFLETKGLLPQNHLPTSEGSANQSTDDRKEKESRLSGVHYLAVPKKTGAGVVEYWQTQMYLNGRTRYVCFGCKQYGFYQERSLAEALRLFFDRGEFPQQKSTQACAENVPHSGSVLILNRYHINARKQPSTPSSSSGHAKRCQREVCGESFSAVVSLFYCFYP
uniref:Uncharacterized protein n=1 Tax=Chromera velia CCMP2878 TaxID=1169474 RepID=A0A0K6S8W7_9ALVE|eukprot:Cvel_25934.t1-p1 / transcript=Cvel_25934.t1 / gene=Cvel_25934 / organism=Chromera_velia_CCMP2878 / gene_product=hypothetical protein / transcript_product=hypothetical protein / location=Cvel_scaffold3002:6597-8377(+) / protein_length=517 / sequence_SO=supercontig / SO=protein_coding / is_pseudo=false